METKKECVDDFLVRRLWMDVDYGYLFVPSVGNSAGLCLIWNSVLIANPSILKGNRWICLTFNWESLCVKVILIYAPRDAIGRMSLWSELQPLLLFEGAALLTRDFNEVLCPVERLNYETFSNSMLQFSSFINLAKFIDLPLQGRRFTWRNSRSASRIDRGLVNAQASLFWPFMTLTALSRN